MDNIFLIIEFWIPQLVLAGESQIHKIKRMYYLSQQMWEQNNIKLYEHLKS